ncbi:MAG TPA: hypothetical protein VL025_15655, partial [Thermoanaerobaculia bacterium]|nr:hypothetical protein [Thermoanaerobaculia bacterium]
STGGTSTSGLCGESGFGLRRQIDLLQKVGWYGRHVAVAMDEAGSSFAGRCCNQSVDQWKPLRHRAANAKGRQGHRVVDRYDVIQELTVILDRPASLFIRSPKFAQAPGKLGQRNARGQNFAAALLEKRLNTSPTGLFR